MRTITRQVWDQVRLPARDQVRDQGCDQLEANLR